MSKKEPSPKKEDINIDNKTIKHENGETNDGVSTYNPIDADTTNIEVDENFRAPKELLQAQSLGNLLDTAVKIPFINFRVGLDFLVGLIPGIGDTIMLLSSMRIVQLGHKLGVPVALKYKMIRNSIIDYCLGFIPILGDIADMFFKANQRNVRIIESWWVAQNKTKIDALAKRELEIWQKRQDEKS